MVTYHSRIDPVSRTDEKTLSGFVSNHQRTTMTLDDKPTSEWQTTDENIVLEMQDVTVTYEMDRGRSTVLDGIDLRIRRGEVLGIVGESGSGKSMSAAAMLNAVEDPGVLTGTVTYHPDEGTPIDLQSLDAEALRRIRWSEIALLAQTDQSVFNPTMTVRDHFLETLRSHDADIDSGMQRAYDLLSDLRMNAEQVLDLYPHDLLDERQQRIFLALSLILDPAVLVLDEPVSALDLLMQRSIISLLMQLKEKYDLTLVVITHALPLVSTIADRLAVMYAFDIVEYGPTTEILENGSHPYTRALVRSVPDMVAPLEEIQSIEGTSPDPVHLPQGCSYHPRCPLAKPECLRDDPEIRNVGDDHAAKCFFWDQAAEAVPLRFQWQSPTDTQSMNE